MVINGNLVGRAVLDIDGYYYFEFDQSRTGWWQGWALRLIGEKMDELNKEWDEQMINLGQNVQDATAFTDGELDDLPF